LSGKVEALTFDVKVLIMEKGEARIERALSGIFKLLKSEVD